MTLPVILVWLVILAALMFRRSWILFLFMSSMAFGDLTLLPLGLTGGLNLPAQTVCAALLVGFTLLEADLRARALHWALDFRYLGALALFGAYGVVSALLMPRLFSGLVYVYGLNTPGYETPLGPTSANFSQIVYVWISIAIAFYVALSMGRPGFLRRYMQAIAFAGLLLALTGIVDYAAGIAGAESLLSGFHNAGYNLLDNETIAGTKRVVGFMPEASVYGQACCEVLGFLVFNFSLFERKFRRLVLFPLIGTLVYLTIESTSSTGYLGLCAIAGLFALRLLLAASSGRYVGGRRFGLANIIIFGGPFLLAILLLVPAGWWSHVQLLFNALLLNKADTSSFIQRTAWTQAGWAAFYATHGLGAGIGSVRTSNWFINILASTGVIGSAAFTLFVLSAIWPVGNTLPPDLRKLRRGVMLALIPAGIMLAASTTTPDPGVWVMSLLGVLCGARFAYRARLRATLPAHLLKTYTGEKAAT